MTPVPAFPDLSDLIPTEDASLDHLTQIGNRSYFERNLNESLMRSEADSCSRSILLLDLDRFKAVNDSLGHAVGDTLLRMAALRMKSLLAEDLVARLGGDEFGIICGAGNDPEVLATQLIELVQRTYLIEGCPVNIGVSIGVASYPADAHSRPDLMRRADLALYEAKATGRNCMVRFRPEIEVRAQKKRALELDLRKALALRQLVLHYRPQVDVQTNALVGLEAVLFWEHPMLGVLDSSTFIPLAEEIGVVTQIGEWVLRSVCRQASRWPNDISISVNISSIQFETMRFVEAVKQSLATAGISGNQLELEVTENLLLRDGLSVLMVLEELRLLGVKVAINSFGTGLASLSQMVNFPLDKIKIAGILVAEQGTGAKERAIVRAIAALGSSLGIATMAEGVNTVEHLERIQRDGCSSVRGYLVTDAVPADQLHDLLVTLSNTNK